MATLGNRNKSAYKPSSAKKTSIVDIVGMGSDVRSTASRDNYAQLIENFEPGAGSEWTKRPGTILTNSIKDPATGEVLVPDYQIFFKSDGSDEIEHFVMVKGIIYSNEFLTASKIQLPDNGLVTFQSIKQPWFKFTEKNLTTFTTKSGTSSGLYGKDFGDAYELTLMDPNKISTYERPDTGTLWATDPLKEDLLKPSTNITFGNYIIWTIGNRILVRPTNNKQWSTKTTAGKTYLSCDESGVPFLIEGTTNRTWLEVPAERLDVWSYSQLGDAYNVNFLSKNPGFRTQELISSVEKELKFDTSSDGEVTNKLAEEVSKFIVDTSKDFSDLSLDIGCKLEVGYEDFKGNETKVLSVLLENSENTTYNGVSKSFDFTSYLPLLVNNIRSIDEETAGGILKYSDNVFARVVFYLTISNNARTDAEIVVDKVNIEDCLLTASLSVYDGSVINHFVAPEKGVIGYVDLEVYDATIDEYIVVDSVSIPTIYNEEPLYKTDTEIDIEIPYWSKATVGQIYRVSTRFLVDGDSFPNTLSIDSYVAQESGNTIIDSNLINSDTKNIMLNSNIIVTDNAGDDIIVINRETGDQEVIATAPILQMYKTNRSEDIYVLTPELLYVFGDELKTLSFNRTLDDAYAVLDNNNLLKIFGRSGSSFYGYTCPIDSVNIATSFTETSYTLNSNIFIDVVTLAPTANGAAYVFKHDNEYYLHHTLLDLEGGVKDFNYNFMEFTGPVYEGTTNKGDWKINSWKNYENVSENHMFLTSGSTTCLVQDSGIVKTFTKDSKSTASFDYIKSGNIDSDFQLWENLLIVINKEDDVYGVTVGEVGKSEERLSGYFEQPTAVFATNSLSTDVTEITFGSYNKTIDEIVEYVLTQGESEKIKTVSDQIRVTEEQVLESDLNTSIYEGGFFPELNERRKLKIITDSEMDVEDEDGKRGTQVLLTVKIDDLSDSSKNRKVIASFKDLPEFYEDKDYLKILKVEYDFGSKRRGLYIEHGEIDYTSGDFKLNAFQEDDIQVAFSEESADPLQGYNLLQLSSISKNEYYVDWSANVSYDNWDRKYHKYSSDGKYQSQSNDGFKKFKSTNNNEENIKYILAPSEYSGTYSYRERFIHEWTEDENGNLVEDVFKKETYKKGDTSYSNLLRAHDRDKQHDFFGRYRAEKTTNIPETSVFYSSYFKNGVKSGLVEFTEMTINEYTFDSDSSVASKVYRGSKKNDYTSTVAPDASWYDPNSFKDTELDTLKDSDEPTRTIDLSTSFTETFWSDTFTDNYDGAFGQDVTITQNEPTTSSFIFNYSSDSEDVTGTINASYFHGNEVSWGSIAYAMAVFNGVTQMYRIDRSSLKGNRTDKIRTYSIIEKNSTLPKSYKIFEWLKLGENVIGIDTSVDLGDYEVVESVTANVSKIIHQSFFEQPIRMINNGARDTWGMPIDVSYKDKNPISEGFMKHHFANSRYELNSGGSVELVCLQTDTRIDLKTSRINTLEYNLLNSNSSNFWGLFGKVWVFVNGTEEVNISTQDFLLEGNEINYIEITDKAEIYTLDFKYQSNVSAKVTPQYWSLEYDVFGNEIGVKPLLTDLSEDIVIDIVDVNNFEIIVNKISETSLVLRTTKALLISEKTETERNEYTYDHFVQESYGNDFVNVDTIEMTSTTSFKYLQFGNRILVEISPDVFIKRSSDLIVKDSPSVVCPTSFGKISLVSLRSFEKVKQVEIFSKVSEVELSTGFRNLFYNVTSDNKVKYTFVDSKNLINLQYNIENIEYTLSDTTAELRLDNKAFFDYKFSLQRVVENTEAQVNTDGSNIYQNNIISQLTIPEATTAEGKEKSGTPVYRVFPGMTGDRWQNFSNVNIINGDPFTPPAIGDAKVLHFMKVINLEKIDLDDTVTAIDKALNLTTLAENDYYKIVSSEDVDGTPTVVIKNGWTPYVDVTKQVNTTDGRVYVISIVIPADAAIWMTPEDFPFEVDASGIPTDVRDIPSDYVEGESKWIKPSQISLVQSYTQTKIIEVSSAEETIDSFLSMRKTDKQWVASCEYYNRLMLASKDSVYISAKNNPYHFPSYVETLPTHFGKIMSILPFQGSLVIVFERGFAAYEAKQTSDGTLYFADPTVKREMPTIINNNCIKANETSIDVVTTEGVFRIYQYQTSTTNVPTFNSQLLSTHINSQIKEELELAVTSGGDVKLFSDGLRTLVCTTTYVTSKEQTKSMINVKVPIHKMWIWDAKKAYKISKLAQKWYIWSGTTLSVDDLKVISASGGKGNIYYTRSDAAEVLKFEYASNEVLKNYLPTRARLFLDRAYISTTVDENGVKVKTLEGEPILSTILTNGLGETNDYDMKVKVISNVLNNHGYAQSYYRKYYLLDKKTGQFVDTAKVSDEYEAVELTKDDGTTVWSVKRSYSATYNPVQLISTNDLDTKAIFDETYLKDQEDDSSDIIIEDRKTIGSSRTGQVKVKIMHDENLPFTFKGIKFVIKEKKHK